MTLVVAKSQVRRIITFRLFTIECKVYLELCFIYGLYHKADSVSGSQRQDIRRMAIMNWKGFFGTLS